MQSAPSAFSSRSICLERLAGEIECDGCSAMTQARLGVKLLFLSRDLVYVGRIWHGGSGFESVNR